VSYRFDFDPFLKLQKPWRVAAVLLCLAGGEFNHLVNLVANVAAD
jgi:hypothetical protein